METTMTLEQKQQLRDFLMKDGEDSPAMTFSMMEGFFAAIATIPTVIDPQEWMSMIFDVDDELEETPFASQDEADVILALVVASHNDVVTGLEEILALDDEELEREDFEFPWTPLFLTDEEESPEDFAMGFLLGMQSFADDEWETYAKDNVELVAPVVILATELANEVSDEEYPDMCVAMFNSVLDVHEEWRTAGDEPSVN
ncbi:MAG TPA: hypothetical protein DIS79_03180 [Bacteroidetes bacterium]|nr:hypothetical protein [Bacteroidota bacterium]HRK04198.1 YecA family protein [Chlorobiota bacterium]